MTWKLGVGSALELGICASSREAGERHRPHFARRAISRCDDAVRREPVLEARERHRLSPFERIEEGLELRLVRMIGDVAAVEHLHRQLAPGMAVESVHLLGMESVVEEAAL